MNAKQLKVLFITVIVFCSHSWLLKSQEVIDKAQFRFSYEFTWHFDTLKLNDQREDLIILQVGQRVSKGFSYYTFKYDSIRATPDGQQIMSSLLAKTFLEPKSRGEIPRNLPYGRRSTSLIYKNHPQGKMTVTDCINADYYIYTDQLNAQEWQIVDSIKTVLDYPCQMAVSDFRGRRWIAWFTPDIAISDGPWKLGGLPGLIMEAYDEQKHYHFTMVAIEKVDDEPIVFSPVILQSGAHGRYQETTRLDFLRGAVRYRLNQNAFMNAQLGRPTFDESGDGNTRHYDLIERDYR